MRIDYSVWIDIKIAFAGAFLTEPPAKALLSARAAS